ncbi:MAG: GxxExxY protein [Saprospiraceae bacterium]|nr:GxxExxY protein [Saprospiraceae bacterium]
MTVELRISQLILQVAFRMHKDLGPGLLESTYLHCMAYELSQLGLTAALCKEMPLQYDNLNLDIGYRIPLLVEKRVVVDIKSHSFTDLHEAQMKTYLRLAQCPLGLLFNFNLISLKHGVRRIVSKESSQHGPLLKSAI